MPQINIIKVYLAKDETEVFTSVVNGFDSRSLTIETVGGVGNVYRAESLCLDYSEPVE